MTDLAAHPHACHQERPTTTEILRGVMDLIVEHGYQKTTVRMVLARSGIAAGALHRLYGSKRELVTAAWRAAMDDAFPVFRAAVDGADTYDAKLGVLFDELYAHLAHDREATLFKLAMRLESHRRPELGAITADARNDDLICEIVDFGVATGEIDEQRAPVARETLIAMVVGISMLTPDLPLDEARSLIDSCRVIFRSSLGTPCGVVVPLRRPGAVTVCDR